MKPESNKYSLNIYIFKLKMFIEIWRTKDVENEN